MYETTYVDVHTASTINI